MFFKRLSQVFRQVATVTCGSAITLATGSVVNSATVGGVNSSTYQDSCYSVSISGDNLSAWCQSPTLGQNGYSNYSTIKIKGIHNSNGLLTFSSLQAPSDYQLSCVGIGTGTTTNILVANCPTTQGIYTQTSIYIPGIANVNGVLTYNSKSTPTPTPITSTPITSTVKGYWDQTYQPHSNIPTDSTLSIAFSGWANPDQALTDSANVQGKLVGDKYIALGGGNSNGKFTQQILNSIITDINNGSFSNYKGIAFDIEEGDAGLTSLFQQAFAAAKTKNLKVLVTTSHSAPYGITDAYTMMETFINDGNIDYLSPQLYTSGTETQNDFTQNQGVSWKDYARAKATIVPSIVQANMYNDAKNQFSQYGVTTSGFIQWAN